MLCRYAAHADEAAFQRGCALVAAIQRQPPAGLREIVPAFTTLRLDFGTGVSETQRESVAGLLQSLGVREASAIEAGEGRLSEIPVRYDGVDLARVAEHAGLSHEEVIVRHLAPVYHVHCLGFAPGFPYLGGLDPRLTTPRLASPRPRVPAGSVAIGGEHAGIYSIPSPGGWNLLGTTEANLFKPRAASLDEMFLLRAGDRVRFVRQNEGGTRETASDPAAEPSSAKQPAKAGLLRVLASGLGIALQDLGRPGFARFGVPPGGAMDPPAALWANRLLENAPSAAVLELCLQGQRLEVLQDGWLAVTGSAAPRGQSANHAFRVRVGDVLEFAPGPAGVWTYLATPGGFAGEPMLGSVSVNARAGIGRGLAPGDVVALAGVSGFGLPAAIAGRSIPWGEAGGLAKPAALRVWPGPQWAMFGEADRDGFFGTEWTVTSQCDRVGYRLSGPVLSPESAQIISEPVLPGSIQVPANGQPIVTMPDGPTLGGYPKLGLVELADLSRLAQCRAGQRVRFVPVG